MTGLKNSRLDEYLDSSSKLVLKACARQLFNQTSFLISKYLRHRGVTSMCYSKEVANDDEILDGTLWEYGMIKAGDKIYIDSRYYLSHGADDRTGGIATVSKVYQDPSCGKNVTFIKIEEFPRISYNWTHYLAKKQRSWKKEFGDKIAHADPDLNPAMNKED